MQDKEFTENLNQIAGTSWTRSGKLRKTEGRKHEEGKATLMEIFISMFRHLCCAEK